MSNEKNQLPPKTLNSFLITSKDYDSLIEQVEHYKSECEVLKFTMKALLRVYVLDIDENGLPKTDIETILSLNTKASELVNWNLK